MRSWQDSTEPRRVQLRLLKRFLSYDAVNDVPFDIVQTHVTAPELESRSRVINAQQAQHRGMQVMNFGAVFDCSLYSH